MSTSLLNFTGAGQTTTQTTKTELFKGYPDMLSVEQFADIFGVSKQAVWAMCRKEQVPNIKVGKRVFIPRDLLSEFVQEAVTHA